MTFYERLVSGHVRLEPGELESLCVFTYGSVFFMWCNMSFIHCIHILFIFNIFIYIHKRFHNAWRVELPIKINLANSRRIAFSLKSFMTSGGLDGIDTGLDGAPGHNASTTLHNCTRKEGTRN